MTMDPDPRVATYLLSNDPFLEELRPVVNDRIDQVQRYISSLDQQPGSNQVAREGIGSSPTTKKLSTDESRPIARHRGPVQVVLSALNRIPPKDIGTILSFALETRDGLLGSPQRFQFKDYWQVRRLGGRRLILCLPYGAQSALHHKTSRRNILGAGLKI